MRLSTPVVPPSNEDSHWSRVHRSVPNAVAPSSHQAASSYSVANGGESGVPSEVVSYSTQANGAPSGIAGM